MKRQKSDLTGLKMTSLHREYMRREKFNNRISNSSSKDLPKFASKSDITSDDSDLSIIDIKIQTNREFFKPIGDLYDLHVTFFYQAAMNLK